eukprot:scaffold442_cov268-Pinguiococcus_pyrenoidosus.AAC.109
MPLTAMAAAPLEMSAVCSVYSSPPAQAYKSTLAWLLCHATAVTGAPAVVSACARTWGFVSTLVSMTKTFPSPPVATARIPSAATMEGRQVGAQLFLAPVANQDAAVVADSRIEIFLLLRWHRAGAQGAAGMELPAWDNQHVRAVGADRGEIIHVGVQQPARRRAHQHAVVRRVHRDGKDAVGRVGELLEFLLRFSAEEVGAMENPDWLEDDDAVVDLVPKAGHHLTSAIHGDCGVGHGDPALQDTLGVVATLEGAVIRPKNDRRLHLSGSQGNGLGLEVGTIGAEADIAVCLDEGCLVFHRAKQANAAPGSEHAHSVAGEA